MKVKEATLLALARLAYTASAQNIQRAYWRFAKHKHGINGRPSDVGEMLATYLIINNLVTKIA